MSSQKLIFEYPAMGISCHLSALMSVCWISAGSPGIMLTCHFSPIRPEASGHDKLSTQTINVIRCGMPMKWSGLNRVMEVLIAFRCLSVIWRKAAEANVNYGRVQSITECAVEHGALCSKSGSLP